MTTCDLIFVREEGGGDEALYDRLVTWLGERRGGLRGKYSVRNWADSPWVAVSRAKFEQGELNLREMSGELGVEIMRVAVQTNVDFFEYHHIRSGQRIRRLEYGGQIEGGWSNVSGESQAWESVAFFDDEVLDEYLDAAETDEERARIRETFERRELKNGRGYPTASAARGLDEVAAHWGLPGLSGESPARGTVVRGASGEAVSALGWAALLAGGSGILWNSIAQDKLAALGGFGFISQWVGSTLLFRRSSVVISIGGGLLGAVVSLSVLFLLGKLF